MTRGRKRKLRRTQATWVGMPLATAILASGPCAVAQQQADTGVLEEVVVTAQKREENLQNVPLSITAIGNVRLEELHITDFNDYVKFLPSVSMQTLGPGFGLAYMRGVSSGENGNHSGPVPTVGMYLDEQPITTIQGALDIHLYDIARVESLAGPQGTLYGASSEAGTIRIITNKPDPGGFKAGYDFEGNTINTGSTGYVAEGFANIPIGSKAAVRLVGWYEHDGGYIDNVAGQRTYPSSGGCVSNAPVTPVGCVASPLRAKKDFNDVDTYGGRVALKIDLNDSWTLTPTVMMQDQKANGAFAYQPGVGDLKTIQFYPDDSKDQWVQAALTVEGKIGNFDVVYAGAYLKRHDSTNSDYSDYSYFYDAYAVAQDTAPYWVDQAGNAMANPSQYIQGRDHYTKLSHELRVSSPQDQRLRFVAGLFLQRQTHEIYQNYLINGLSTTEIVTGWPDTIWLTNEDRLDKDRAAFTELSFDLTDKLTATGGVRLYKSENSIVGFFGFGAGYSSNYGEALCVSPTPYKGAPCTSIAPGGGVSKTGSIAKFNLTYHVDGDRMIYATVSQGFRPGGINRNNTVPPYKPDFLTNYELGWKTSWADRRFRFNGALFFEKWKDIQFSFLPPSGSGLTVIRNAGTAEIKGIEADLTWAALDKFTLTGGFSLLDAKLTSDYIPDPTLPPTAPNGTQLPVTPKFKANLTARYTFGLGSFDAFWQGAMVYQGAVWADLQTSDRQALGQQAAYSAADLSAGISKSSYSLELYVNNAFDKRADTYRFAQCATDKCGPDPFVVPNQPRTIGIRFGQKF